jgi:Leucine-rich repeat (LRR) protein
MSASLHARFAPHREVVQRVPLALADVAPDGVPGPAHPRARSAKRAPTRGRRAVAVLNTLAAQSAIAAPHGRMALAGSAGVTAAGDIAPAGDESVAEAHVIDNSTLLQAMADWLLGPNTQPISAQRRAAALERVYQLGDIGAAAPHSGTSVFQALLDVFARETGKAGATAAQADTTAGADILLAALLRCLVDWPIEYPQAHDRDMQWWLPTEIPAAQIASELQRRVRHSLSIDAATAQWVVETILSVDAPAVLRRDLPHDLCVGSFEWAMLICGSDYARTFGLDTRAMTYGQLLGICDVMVAAVRNGLLAPRHLAPAARAMRMIANAWPNHGAGRPLLDAWRWFDARLVERAATLRRLVGPPLAGEARTRERESIATLIALATDRMNVDDRHALLDGEVEIVVPTKLSVKTTVVSNTVMMSLGMYPRGLRQTRTFDVLPDRALVRTVSPDGREHLFAVCFSAGRPSLPVIARLPDQSVTAALDAAVREWVDGSVDLSGRNAERTWHLSRFPVTSQGAAPGDDAGPVDARGDSVTALARTLAEALAGNVTPAGGQRNAIGRLLPFGQCIADSANHDAKGMLSSCLRDLVGFVPVLGELVDGVIAAERIGGSLISKAVGRLLQDIPERTPPVATPRVLASEYAAHVRTDAAQRILAPDVAGIRAQLSSDAQLGPLVPHFDAYERSGGFSAAGRGVPRVAAHASEDETVATAPADAMPATPVAGSATETRLPALVDMLRRYPPAALDDVPADAGSRYARIGEDLYPVHFDSNGNTWRVFHPRETWRPGLPVRFNGETNQWEFNGTTGLRGGGGCVGRMVASDLDALVWRWAQSERAGHPAGPYTAEDLIDLVGQALVFPHWGLRLARIGVRELPPALERIDGLRMLDGRENQLEEVRLSGMNALEHLDLGFNRLRSVALEALPRLQTAILRRNEISEFVLRDAPSIQELDLSNNSLASIAGLDRLPQSLRTLRLNANCITELPASIANWQFVGQLELRSNGLTELRAEIQGMHNLSSLSLGHNRLQALPRQIGLVSSLETLVVNDNALSGLPAELGRLHRLQVLNAANNQIAELPDAITELRRLYMMDLGNNALTRLPPDMDKLKALRVLNLSNNRLQVLPPELGRLDLTTVNLSGNRLETLPASLVSLRNLHTLNLANNALTDVPAWFADLPRHCTVDLRGNPLSPQAYARLETLPNCTRILVGERETLDGGRRNLAAAVDAWLARQAHRGWLGSRERELQMEAWRVIAEEQSAWAFATLLDDLPMTSEYSGITTRSGFTARVIETLDAVRADPDLRIEAFDAAAASVGTCSDGVALTWNNIEMAALASRARQGSGQLTAQQTAALLELVRGQFRRNALDTFGRRLVEERRDISEYEVDDVEVLLALRVRLADALGLPVPPRGMTFPSFARFDPQDMYDAVRAVREAETHEAIVEAALSQSFWTRHLERLHVVDFDAIRDDFSDQMNALFEARDALPDAEYLGRANALAQQRERAFDALHRELTQHYVREPRMPAVSSVSAGEPGPGRAARPGLAFGSERQAGSVAVPQARGEPDAGAVVTPASWPDQAIARTRAVDRLFPTTTFVR